MKFINKVKDNLFVYNFLLLLVFLVVSFILYLFNLRFRLWFIILIIVIFLICFIVSLVKTFLKENKVIKIVGLSLVSILVICISCFYDFWLLLFGWILTPEYVTEVDGKKYVGCVKWYLDETDVSYYDYYGLLVGTNEKIRGNFGSGNFNPFKDTDKINNVHYTFFDKDGKVIYEKVDSYTKDKDGNINITNEQDINSDVYIKEEDSILYEAKFGKTVIRVKKTSNVLGQRMTVGVYKSFDGKDFKLVTNDGGKTFKTANFNYKNDNIEYMEIASYPYFENEMLNLTCEIYSVNDKGTGYENKKLHFVSKDGVNWELK